MSLLKIATRNSPLALWQAEFVRDLLKQHHPELFVEIISMTTTGDKLQKQRLLQYDGGGKGLFVKELETALLTGQADIAVHSMKDVPTEFPEGLGLGAITERASPFDALIANGKTLKELPLTARIGTASLRRSAQLYAINTQFNISPLRGNLQTRLQKLDDKEFDAIILAEAGLKRMGLAARISEILTPKIMLPAAGQGALGIEYRLEDSNTAALLAPLNHEISEACVVAEREVNRICEGGCHTPVAIFCTPISNNNFKLQAKVLAPDGSISIYSCHSGSNPLMLAAQCAEDLLQQGAKALIASNYS